MLEHGIVFFIVATAAWKKSWGWANDGGKLIYTRKLLMALGEIQLEMDFLCYLKCKWISQIRNANFIIHLFH